MQREKLRFLQVISVLKGLTSCPGFVDFLTGKVDAGRVAFYCLLAESVQNKYGGMLAWEEGIIFLFFDEHLS